MNLLANHPQSRNLHVKPPPNDPQLPWSVLCLRQGTIQNFLSPADISIPSTSMAINFSGGVILGADSRTTTGAYIANRVTDKLTQVHDTIWCCRSGSAADTQAVADIVQYHLGMYGITNDEQPTTQTAAALFQELCYDNKDRLRWEIKVAVLGSKCHIFSPPRKYIYSESRNYILFVFYASFPCISIQSTTCPFQTYLPFIILHIQSTNTSPYL